jgi:hypothetical protein
MPILQHPVVGAGHAGAHALDLLEIESRGDVANLVLGRGDDVATRIGDQRVAVGVSAAAVAASMRRCQHVRLNLDRPGA